jgi:hypothetical protein
MAGDYLRQANELIVAMKANREPTPEKTINKDILTIPGTFAFVKFINVYLENFPDLVFYFGQRPWRIKQGSAANLDPLIESAAKLALEVGLISFPLIRRCLEQFPAELQDHYSTLVISHETVSDLQMYTHGTIFKVANSRGMFVFA